MGWFGNIYSPNRWIKDEYESFKTLKDNIPYWGGEKVFKYIIGYENDDYSQGDIVGFLPERVVLSLINNELILIEQHHGGFIIIDNEQKVVWGDVGKILSVKKDFLDVCCCHDNKHRLCYYCGRIKNINFNDYKKWKWE